jgi:hypothetical protein
VLAFALACAVGFGAGWCVSFFLLAVGSALLQYGLPGLGLTDAGRVRFAGTVSLYAGGFVAARLLLNLACLAAAGRVAFYPARLPGNAPADAYFDRDSRVYVLSAPERHFLRLYGVLVLAGRLTLFALALPVLGVAVAGAVLRRSDLFRPSHPVGACFWAVAAAAFVVALAYSCRVAIRDARRADAKRKEKEAAGA